MQNRDAVPDEGNGGEFDDKEVESFLLALLIGLGSWLGGRTGQAVWEGGKDLFSSDDDEEEE